MSKFKNIYRVESIRLKTWDYSTPWWYFITICTNHHIKWFGNILNMEMRFNNLGNIADRHWQDIPNHFPNAELDYYIIMPNHVHGIIIIKPNKSCINHCGESMQFINSSVVACNDATDNFRSEISPKKGSLAAIVRSYKSAVTKQIHESGCKDFSWQSKYYDRIIRNEKELFNIRRYIVQNPLRWEIEKLTPHNLEMF